MYNVKKIAVLFFSVVFLFINRGPIYAIDLSVSLEPYYKAVQELNIQYNASIQMPSVEKLNNVEEILSMKVSEFKKQIEAEYLSVAIFQDSQNVQGNCEDNILLMSSGRKTQYCHIYNTNKDEIGRLYLSADVVEAGVNQYTAIRGYGTVEIVGSSWFSLDKASASLSNYNKTCTVTYSGSFVDKYGMTLTSYITYDVQYQASGGDVYLMPVIEL